MADDHSPSEMAVHCPGCDGPVIGKPHGYTTAYDPQNGPPERWTLLQCPKGHTMLVLQEEYTGMEFDDDSPYRMYPPQDRRLSNDIPEPLRVAHDEARKCSKPRDTRRQLPCAVAPSKAHANYRA